MKMTQCSWKTMSRRSLKLARTATVHPNTAVTFCVLSNRRRFSVFTASPLLSAACLTIFTMNSTENMWTYPRSIGIRLPFCIASTLELATEDWLVWHNGTYFLSYCLRQSNTHRGNHTSPCCKNDRGPGRRLRFFDAPEPPLPPVAGTTGLLTPLKLGNTSCPCCCWKWFMFPGVGVGGGWSPSRGRNPCAKPDGLIGTWSAMLCLWIRVEYLSFRTVNSNRFHYCFCWILNQSFRPAVWLYL